MNTREIVEIKNPSSMKIKFDTGLDEFGKATTKTRSFGFIRPDAKGQDIRELADLLGTLQNDLIISVIRIDNTDLAL